MLCVRMFSYGLMGYFLALYFRAEMLKNKINVDGP